MCKNSENGAKLPISTKCEVEKLHGGHRTGGAVNVRSALATHQRILWMKRLRTYRKLRDRVLFYERRRSNIRPGKPLVIE